MTVSVLSDGSIKADVVLTHYGHEKELQHIRVTKQRRNEIAAKMRQGVSRDKILDEIRDGVTSNLCRHQLMTRKDLANIERAYGLRDVQRHANDQQSVLAWIQEWKQAEENPILYYKLQGQEAEDGYDLAKDDFFIAMQTPLQKQMFQKFASKGVCCDTTHGTNAYDFSLTTILVIDEYGQGFPAGWCLSSHEDFTTMTIFFNEIKKNAGDVHSTFFMSDMAPQFYNAWVAVMGNPRPIKLVCTWHVDKAWKEELRKKIGDLAVEAEVYKLLRIVLQQTHENVFEDCLHALLQRLKSDPKCAQFYAYFTKEWVPKKSQWAYCYRRGLQINTNIYVEAFHRVFKRLYLKGKINKRVDTCLVNLQKYARDMGFDRLIKMTKGKMTYRMNAISERHLQSLTLPADCVESLGDGRWKVLSENGTTFYEVAETSAACPERDLCKMVCKECQLCIHTFQCTCPDSLIMSTICKHIHLVKRITSNDAEALQNDKHAASTISEKEDEEIETVLKCIRSRPDDISASKSRIKGTLLQLMEELDKSVSSSALKQLEKQLAAAHSLFISLNNEKEQNVIPLKNNVNEQRAFLMDMENEKREKEEPVVGKRLEEG